MQREPTARWNNGTMIQWRGTLGVVIIFVGHVS